MSTYINSVIYIPNIEFIKLFDISKFYYINNSYIRLIYVIFIFIFQILIVVHNLKNLILLY